MEKDPTKAFSFTTYIVSSFNENVLYLIFWFNFVIFPFHRPFLCFPKKLFKMCFATKCIFGLIYLLNEFGTVCVSNVSNLFLSNLIIKNLN
jgi:hypothetical protein